MAINYKLADDLQHLAYEAEGVIGYLNDLEMRLQTQQEEYEKLEEQFEAFKDYVDSVDDRILTAWRTQEKIT